MGEKLSQVQYVSSVEFMENARMKRRQSEILLAEASILEKCADAIRHAIDVDRDRSAKLLADSAPIKPDDAR